MLTWWHRLFSIGSNALDSSSLFDINSTTKGARPAPSMTEAQRNAIASPADGLEIYNTDEKTYEYYDGTSWRGLGGGGVGYQETIGVGDGIVLSFSLAFIPSNEKSVLVFANNVRVETTEWTYNTGTQQIDFVTAPATAVDIYVFYLTSGNTIAAPTPSGIEFVEYITLSNADITNKFVTLAGTPISPANTILDVIQGSSQAYTTDFTVSTNILSWSGLGLDGVLTASDKLRIHYFT